jgi:hypothetical protein
MSQEHLATLVVTRLRVRMIVDNFHAPFCLLEPRITILVHFGIHLLFALPLVRRRAILTLLLLL